MVLSAIRKFEDGVADLNITSEDTDFQTAFALAELYKQYALLMFTALLKSEENQLNQNNKYFYGSRPADRYLTRQEVTEIGLVVGTKERTVGKYIMHILSRFLEQPLK